MSNSNRKIDHSLVAYRHVFVCLAVATSLLWFGGCGYRTAQGKTKVLDASAQDTLGGTGTSSADIRTIADRMARAIAGIKIEGDQKPQVNMLPIQNSTRFRIDPGILRNKLMAELMKRTAGKWKFIARDSEQQVMQERDKKRAGLYDAGSTSKTLLGADYLLKGEMRALSKASRDGVSDYIVYSFQLINAEDAQIVWMDDYETKKQSAVGVMYQ